jgi:adenylate kinase family enzyme
MINRVHIFGASGSGTTTLGGALSRKFDCPFFDADDYFWVPTSPPFEKKRERKKRQKMLINDLQMNSRWVLSGSLCGWGDIAIPFFDLVVFLWVPKEIRISRLQNREIERYGVEVIQENGSMYQKSKEFTKWAAAYDEGDSNMRSRKKHEEWLNSIPCKVLRIEGNLSVDEQLLVISNCGPFGTAI